jgi:hypothetical protein
VSALSEAKRNLRKRSEYYLRLAVLSELGRGQPSTVEPYKPRGGVGWRMLFVPVYRRLPWKAKERAMNALGMTARGWQPPARKPGEPWRPPAGLKLPPARSAESDPKPQEAPPAR